MPQCEDMKTRIAALEKELVELKKITSCEDPMAKMRNLRKAYFDSEIHVPSNIQSSLGTAVMAIIRETLDYNHAHKDEYDEIWAAALDMQEELLPIVCKYYKRREAIRACSSERTLAEYVDTIRRYVWARRHGLPRATTDVAKIRELHTRLLDFGYSKEHLRTFLD